MWRMQWHESNLYCLNSLLAICMLLNFIKWTGAAKQIWIAFLSADFMRASLCTKSNNGAIPHVCLPIKYEAVKGRGIFTAISGHAEIHHYTESFECTARFIVKATCHFELSMVHDDTICNRKHALMEITIGVRTKLCAVMWTLHLSLTAPCTDIQWSVQALSLKRDRQAARVQLPLAILKAYKNFKSNLALLKRDAML